MKIIMTLCILTQDDKVLLAMKKRGFGEGRWNGLGGKVNKGESINEAVVRESFEEAEVKPQNPEKKGIITFYFDDKDDIYEVHIFKADSYDGEPKESEEMNPEWFNKDKIPYSDMWPGDKHWLPVLLEDKYFKGEFFFRDENELLRHTILDSADSNVLFRRPACRQAK